MPNSNQGISTLAPTDETTFQAVACPFCGLHCDDLAVANSAGRLRVERNGCARAKAGFERALPQATPLIDGRPATLDAAVARVASLLKAARLPLFGGLGTDVEGMRGIMALADRAGGVVDHVLSTAQYRNTGVLQTKGWFMSTLTETRNRADLIIVVASDLDTHHPRFYERIAAPPQTMFDQADGARTIVLLGCGARPTSLGGKLVGNVIDIACAPEATPTVLGYLRTLLKGAPVNADPPGGVSRSVLEDLVQRCRQAHYGVVVWAPQAMAFADADLAVQMISDLVRDLNKTTRFAGLSLGGNDGAASAASVCSWQSGYPLRVSFASGAPDYDPYRFEIARMLRDGEGDLVVWVSTFGPDAQGPPETSLPTVVLGTPGITLRKTADVFIPVATPGLDHSGRVVRCDAVVSLPLKQVRSSPHPRLADVTSAITAAL